MAESVDAACNVQLDLVCSDRIDARRPRTKLSSFMVFTLTLDSEIYFPPQTDRLFCCCAPYRLGGSLIE